MSEAPCPEPTSIPIVGYLRHLGGAWRLVAQVCDVCDARYFDRRIACASCEGRSFSERVLPDAGELAAFTIVHRAPPGVDVPFVSGVVRLDDGTTVRANVVDCPPDDAYVSLRMPLRLTTFAAGTDANGTTAVGFAYRPEGRAIK